MPAVPKTGPRSGTNFATHSFGQVIQVEENRAQVRLAGGQVISVRADMLPGKSAAPVADEVWVLDQRYGRWMFAVPVGYQGPAAVAKFALTLGDGVAVTYPVVHGLGTLDVLVQVYHPVSRVPLTPTIMRTDPDTVTLTFTTPPATGAVRVVVLG